MCEELRKLSSSFTAFLLQEENVQTEVIMSSIASCNLQFSHRYLTETQRCSAEPLSHSVIYLVD